MATSTEKLATLKAELVPMLREQVPESTRERLLLGLLGSALPMLDPWVSEQLARPAEEVDAALVNVIEVIGAQLSDNHPEIVVGPLRAPRANVGAPGPIGPPGVR